MARGFHTQQVHVPRVNIRRQITERRYLQQRDMRQFLFHFNAMNQMLFNEPDFRLTIGALVVVKHNQPGAGLKRRGRLYESHQRQPFAVPGRWIACDRAVTAEQFSIRRQMGRAEIIDHPRRRQHGGGENDRKQAQSVKQAAGYPPGAQIAENQNNNGQIQQGCDPGIHLHCTETSARVATAQCPKQCDGQKNAENNGGEFDDQRPGEPGNQGRCKDDLEEDFQQVQLGIMEETVLEILGEFQACCDVKEQCDDARQEIGLAAPRGRMLQIFNRIFAHGKVTS